MEVHQGLDGGHGRGSRIWIALWWTLQIIGLASVTHFGLIFGARYADFPPRNCSVNLIVCCAIMPDG